MKRIRIIGSDYRPSGINPPKSNWLPFRELTTEDYKAECSYPKTLFAVE